MGPVQAHPQRCPVVKEAKAAEAIRDLEKQGILKKVTETLHGFLTVFTERNPMEAYGYVLTPSQTINKAIEVPKYPIPTVDELSPKLNNAKKTFLCGCVQGVHEH